MLAGGCALAALPAGTTRWVVAISDVVGLGSSEEALGATARRVIAAVADHRWRLPVVRERPRNPMGSELDALTGGAGHSEDPVAVAIAIAGPLPRLCIDEAPEAIPERRIVERNVHRQPSYASGVAAFPGAH